MSKNRIGNAILDKIPRQMAGAMEIVHAARFGKHEKLLECIRADKAAVKAAVDEVSIEYYSQ